MKALGLLGVILMLSLGGCGRSHAPIVLEAQPLDRHTKVAMLNYYRRDVPLGLNNPRFEVRAEDPKVKVEQVEYKLGTAPRPTTQRGSSLSLVIAQDQSISLAHTDPTELRFPAVRTLIESLPADTRTGFLCFASLRWNQYGDFDQMVPIASNNRDQLLRAIERLKQSDYSQWGTPLWNTLWGAVALLEAEPATALRQVLCFTDGQNETPPEILNRTPDEVIQRAVKAKVILSFVVLGDETTIPTYYETVGILDRMAQATGGSVITVREAQELNRAFTQAGQTLGREPCYFLHCRLVRQGGYPANQPVYLRVRALPNGVERRYRFNAQTGGAKPL